MIWFIFSNNEVKGPLNKEEVAASEENSLVWGPNMSSWTSKADWQKTLSSKSFSPLISKPNTVSPLNNTSQKQITQDLASKHADFTSEHSESTQLQSSSESTQIQQGSESPQAQQNQELWHYACNNEKFGPLTQDELIQTLSMLDFSSQVYLWKKGLTKWAKLEDFPLIIKQLTKPAA